MAPKESGIISSVFARVINFIRVKCFNFES